MFIIFICIIKLRSRFHAEIRFEIPTLTKILYFVYILMLKTKNYVLHTQQQLM
jgi:hypothetical protein